MKHAIQLLEAEFERLQVKKLEYRKTPKPDNVRPSEWAMTGAQIETQRLETFDALQALKRIRKERGL